MTAYLLLMIAASWHALGIGTQGHRGRIVHAVTALGMIWGALTPPWGWVQIGAAVGTVLFARWIITDEGRRFVQTTGVLIWAMCDATLRLIGRTFRWVLSPATHEAPPVTFTRLVSVPRDTLGSQMASTPPGHLFEPEAWKRGTAADTTARPVLTPVETYADIIGSVVAGTLGYNDGARYVQENYGASRSKFARDVRATREEAA